jgi:hypothetical protein
MTNNDDMHSNVEATIEISVDIEELERIVAPGVATSPGPIKTDINYHAKLPVQWGSKSSI